MSSQGSIESSEVVGKLSEKRTWSQKAVRSSSLLYGLVKLIIHRSSHLQRVLCLGHGNACFDGSVLAQPMIMLGEVAGSKLQGVFAIILEGS
eukprot:5177596-Amphidinium_carterae.1